jgi:NADH-quinone oxidoreductase subunit A
MQETQLSAFGEILLYIIGAIVFIGGGLFTAYLIRPFRPNEEKLATYECGEEPTGTAWGQFNVRFYIIALIFILFEVELIFFFPWATVFGQQALVEGTQGVWGWFAIVEMFAFVFILALGLAYAWAKGYLNWIKPHPEVSLFKSKVPSKYYEEFNKKI